MSLATLLPVDTIAVPGIPGVPAYDNATGELFVPLSNGNLTVVVAANRTVVRTVPVSPIAAGGQLYSAVYDPNHHVVFVADSTLDQVDLLDPSTLNVTKRIPVAAEPLVMTLAPTISRLFVPTFGGNTLDVLDTSNDSVVRSASVGTNPVQAAYVARLGDVFVGAEGGPITVLNASTGSSAGSVALNGSESVVYDPGDDRVWATVRGSTSLALIDPANLSSAPGASANGSTFLVVDAGGGRVFVLAPGADRVSVLSATSGRWLGAFAIGLFPYFLSRGSSDTTVWVVDQLNGWVVPVDGNGLTVGRPIVNLSLPGEVSVDIGRHEVYIPTGDRTVAILNSSSGVLVAQVSVGGGPAGTSYDAPGHRLYVADSSNQTVTVVDTLLRKVAGTVHVGLQPFSIALDPVGHRLFVGNLGSSNVSIINSSTLRPVASAAVSASPRSLSYDAVDQRLFVGSETTGAITVVNLSDLAHPTNLTVGVAIEGVAYDSTSGTLYAADEGRGTVLRINASSLTNLSSIPVGGGPTPELIDPATGTLWVGNFFGGSISVIRTGDPAPLTSVRLLATPPSVELGNVTLLTTIAIGGSGTLSFSYSGLPIGCTSIDSPELSCAPRQSGNFTVQVTVNDSAGASDRAVSNLTASGTFPPRVAYFLLTPATLDVGSLLSVQVGIAGGAPPLSFTYGGLPTGCRSVNAPTLICHPAASGPFSISFVVLDARGRAVGSSRPLVVNALPTVAAILTSPASLEAGVSATLSVAIFNGTAPFDVSWNGLPAGCVTANLSILPCTPNGAGTVDVSVSVTDSVDMTATGSSFVTVLAGPTISRFEASRSDVTIGRATTLEVRATGGAGPLHLTYTGLPPGCLSANQTPLVCRPVEIGLFVINVQVADAQGISTSDSLVLSVHPPPSIAAFNVTPNELTLGGVFVVSLESGGGSGPLRFTYSGLPPGCSAGNTTRWFCHPTASGRFNLQVVATDSEGVATNDSRMLQVDPSAAAPNAAPPNSPWTILVSLVTLGCLLGIVVAMLVHHRRRYRRERPRP